MIEKSRPQGAPEAETTFEEKRSGVRPTGTVTPRAGIPQTLSINHVKMSDVPVVLDDRDVNRDDAIVVTLLAAVDGVRTVAEIGHVTGIDLHQCRAYFALMGNDGVVAFERETPSIEGEAKPTFRLEDEREK